METWQPVLPKYGSSGKPVLFKMYFWLIGLEVVLVLIGDHLLCWFFLWMLKVGAGSPVFFFRTSKLLIEGAIKEFRRFWGQEKDRLSCPGLAVWVKLPRPWPLESWVLIPVSKTKNSLIAPLYRLISSKSESFKYSSDWMISKALSYATRLPGKNKLQTELCTAHF